MSEPIKGGVMSERRVTLCEDLRDVLRVAIANKGSREKCAEAIGLSCGQNVTAFLNGSRGISMTTWLALLKYTGYTMVLHKTQFLPVSANRGPGSGEGMQ